jgi:hypothetical protein
MKEKKSLYKDRQKKASNQRMIYNYFEEWLRDEGRHVSRKKATVSNTKKKTSQ